jgi:UDP-N-acetyl-D-galactosamine dehydrogenase
METKEVKVCVIGLGYVGLPLARLFSTKFETIGYDIKAKRIETLREGVDVTGEVEDSLLREAIEKHGLRFTSKTDDIRGSNFYVVAVPTPVDENNRPVLDPLRAASEIVGNVVQRGDIVVYESTVYPGVTEEVCLPIVERVSGLKVGRDFGGGYSPERINPGDKVHTVETVRKITSGSDEATSERIAETYGAVIKAGIYKAPNIRVAEAAKIVENVQRDVNIGLMNELARVFNAMGIDTGDVIEAAGTKWNFIKMQPGLVGGHCIGVDPYYLIEKAQAYGVLPRIMTDARRLNDCMGAYVAQEVVKLMNKKGLMVKDARVLILGFTFKENCKDIRNTKIVDIDKALREYTDNISIYDTWADKEEVRKSYGIEIENGGVETLKGKYDAVIVAVAHKEFEGIDVRGLLEDRDKGVVYDVKGKVDRGMVDGRL